MQSVPITINVVSSHPEQAIQHAMKFKLVTDLQQVDEFLRGYSGSSTNKTDRHYITEIFLKMALNTINQTKLNKSHGFILESHETVVYIYIHMYLYATIKLCYFTLS